MPFGSRNQGSHALDVAAGNEPGIVFTTLQAAISLKKPGFTLLWMTRQDQGLTLVHFSAQPELFLYTLYTSSYP